MLASVIQTFFHKSQVRFFNLSSQNFKERKPFSNRYIEIYRNKQFNPDAVATQFISKSLKRAKEGHSGIREENNMVQNMIRSGAKRLQANRKGQRLKHLTKGSGPRVLTWDQTEHMRFLHQEYPSSWNFDALAHAFNVDKLIVKKVINCRKSVMGPELREKLDAEARAYQRQLQSSAAVTTVHNKNEKSLAVTRNKNDFSENKWFKDLKKTFELNAGNNNQSNHPKKSDSQVAWIPEEDSDFYKYMYSDDMVENEQVLPDDQRNDDSNTDDDFDMELHGSEDNKEFYDEDGNLVYRVT